MLPERHVFICNAGKSCAKVGSAEVYAKFRKLLKKSNMKPRVAVTGCGSIGFCDRGVAVAIYPEQVWYSRVTEDDVEEIWNEHVLGGRVVERLRDELVCEMPDQGPAPFQSDADPFLAAAIEEARKGRDEGGIPIGAVLVIDGAIVGRGHNRRVQDGSVIRHAEMDCLERAGRLSTAEYRRSVLYTTLSPCDMCSGTILLYGIPKVVIGDSETFRGPEDHLRNRGVRLVLARSAECRAMLREFIAAHPDLWHEDIGS